MISAVTVIFRVPLPPLRLLLRALVVIVIGTVIVGWLGSNDC